jgi:hypothetical protein
VRTMVWIKAFTKRGLWLATMAFAGMAAVSLYAQTASSGSDIVGMVAMAEANSAARAETKDEIPDRFEAAGSAAGLVQAVQKQAPDPCGLKEVTANPTRPAWDYAASTTQCGVVEMDSGWEMQPMGGGVSQRMLVSSVRYGLTPKLDLRWGITDRMAQSGGGVGSLEGAGDQWLNARYRFEEQGKWTPAMALLYGLKIPAASPAKGFGSGYVDNQFILIVSRDLGRNHLDFNTSGTVAGGPVGADAAREYEALADSGELRWRAAGNSGSDWRGVWWRDLRSSSGVCIRQRVLEDVYGGHAAAAVSVRHDVCDAAGIRADSEGQLGGADAGAIGGLRAAYSLHVAERGDTLGAVPA